MKIDYFIREENVSFLKDKIEKLSKKSLKNGFDPITVTVTDETEIRKIVVGEDKNRNPIEEDKLFVKVIVEGTDPHFEGWALIATIEHDPVLGTLFKVAPDKEVPHEFREISNTRCDHCKVERTRNKTFIVEKDNEYKVIGSTCLKDFLAVDRITKYLFIAELPKIINDLLTDYNECGYGRSEICYNLETALGATIEVVGKLGYVSKKMAEEKMICATSAEVAWGMSYSPYKTEKDLNYHFLKDEHKEEVEKIINWAKESLNPEFSDFNYTLMKMVNAGYVKANYLAFVTCLIPMYRKAMNLLSEKQNKKPSEYVGNIKDKITKKLTFKNSWAFSSFYGTCYINKFEDEENNVFVWKTSVPEKFEIDNVYNIKGTIKEHSEFRDTKQTIITRCKMI